MHKDRNFVWYSIPQEEWDAIFKPEPNPQLELEDLIQETVEGWNRGVRATSEAIADNLSTDTWEEETWDWDPGLGKPHGWY